MIFYSKSLMTLALFRCVAPDSRQKIWSFHLLDLRELFDRLFFFLGRWYDLPTQLALELILEEGSNVVDVGASYGHFSLAAASLVGKNATVIAFEPNPSAFVRLGIHIDLNRLTNIRIYNAGLSNKEDELVLNIPESNSGEASFTDIKNDNYKSIRCPIYVGDEIIGEQAISCIKIDVEGFEVRVLQGLLKAIKRDRPWIIIEVLRKHLARDHRTPNDLGKILKPYGYIPMLIGLDEQNKQLVMHSFDFDTDEGEVLWIPEDKISRVKNVLGDMP